jgi:hypothetical protein
MLWADDNKSKDDWLLIPSKLLSKMLKAIEKRESLQDKTKAARSFCVLIQAHNYLLNFSSSGENFINLLFCCIKWHIPHINGDRCQECMFEVLLCSRKSSIPICWKPRWILKIMQNRIINKSHKLMKKHWVISW